MCFCQYWYLALTASFLRASLTTHSKLIPLFNCHSAHTNKLCCFTRFLSKYELPILLMFLVLLYIALLFSISFLEYGFLEQFSRWVWCGTSNNGTIISLLLLEMFALEHLRIGFAFFTDASHYFRNLIPLKRTIKLKWHWNKLILTLLLYWLSKQSTFFTGIFPSLYIRFHLFIIKSDFPV